MVEKKVGGEEQITVVTSDLEVARHAKAMGADVSLADLFMASALGSTGAPRGEGRPDEESEPEDKPPSLSKKELAEWAEIFSRRRGPTPEGEDETLH
jgi:hypothetical protein